MLKRSIDIKIGGEIENKTNLKVLHVISSSDLSAGGLFIAASSLSDALLSFGTSCHIVAQSFSKDKKLAQKTKTPLDLVPSTTFLNTGYSPNLKSIILRLSDDVDILHAHGVWTYHILCASYVSKIKSKPLIISPHGMLEPWIISRAKLKKRIANLFYHNSSLRKAACLHALSIKEMLNLRALKLDIPIAVIPNGTTSPNRVMKVWKSKLSEKYPEVFGKNIMLFLSRVHPKKGLLNLLQSWKKATAITNNWHLIIAGPDEQGHLKTVNNCISNLDLSSSVTIVGPVAGKQKAHLYSTSKAFVLPSFSEGFSMSILEAMSYGIPCLYTNQCNFPEGGEKGAAIIANPTLESISDMLSNFFSLTEDERTEMGNKGKLMVSRFYTWDRMAKKMYRLYQSIKSGNKFPCSDYF